MERDDSTDMLHFRSPIFQSTHHTGCDEVSNFRYNQKGFISIHAPHTGCDCIT